MTTIPVPQLLSHGSYADGRRYLVTELIEGVLLDQLPNKGCSRPEGQKHTDGKACEICSAQAYSNALRFIQDTVLPQLANLRSHDRGISGFVMPPSWLTPDLQPPWKGKTHWKTLSQQVDAYVFQHGDIAAHNLMMDPQTLEVKALIDWEYAGFFPPGMEGWPGTLDSGTYRKRSDRLAYAIAAFLPEEYLECYDEWDDKEELATLIKLGELPHPDQVRQAHNVEQLKDR